LLLLLAVCAIPFALAQRNAANRSMAKPPVNPNLVLNPAAGVAPPVTGAAQTQASSVRERGTEPLPAWHGNTSTSRSDVPFLKPQQVPSMAHWARRLRAGIQGI